MKTSSTIILAALAVLASSAQGFSVVSSSPRDVTFLAMSTMAESGVPPATSEPSTDVEEAAIPTNLPSEKGIDYVPLATMLATGQLAEADQVCTSCIVVSSSSASKEHVHHALQ